MLCIGILYMCVKHALGVIISDDEDDDDDDDDRRIDKYYVRW